jgi:nascent polypeptide-associated complex subunit alpha
MSDEKKILDVTEAEDEEVPDLVAEDDVAEDAEVEEDASGDQGSKQSRSEKKARKALSKLGLKQVDDISRVTIRKGKSILFAMTRPDVFKSPFSDTYIVFGEARIEDLSQNAMATAAEKLMKEQSNAASKAGDAAEEEEIEVESAETETAKATEGATDGKGIDENDIELVMQQGNVGRDEAIAALEKSGGDIVNAIMSLAM